MEAFILILSTCRYCSCVPVRCMPTGLYESTRITDVANQQRV